MFLACPVPGGTLRHQEQPNLPLCATFTSPSLVSQCWGQGQSPGLGWNGVNFPHSGWCGAMLWI